jgi:hypothetical protein
LLVGGGRWVRLRSFLLLTSLGGLFRICTLLSRWVLVSVHYVIMQKHILSRIYFVVGPLILGKSQPVNVVICERNSVYCVSTMFTVLQQQKVPSACMSTP